MAMEQGRTASWYHQILFNRDIDWRRIKKERRTIYHEHSAIEQDSLETLLFAEDKKHLLKIALQAIEPKERVALILHYFKEVSITEIAQILGIAVDGVETLLFNVRKKLLQQLPSLMVFSSKVYREH